MARAMSADVDYMDTCKVSGPQKEVAFYPVYAVQIELLRVSHPSRVCGLNRGKRKV